MMRGEQGEGVAGGDEAGEGLKISRPGEGAACSDLVSGGLYGTRRCAKVLTCLVTIAGSASRGGGGLGGGGGASGGGGSGSRSGGPSGTGSAYNFADGRVEEDRINADELRGTLPDDEEDGYSATGAKITTTKKKRAILPVGIKREEVQDGGVELTTAEDIAAGEKAAEGDADESDSESMFVDTPSHKAEPGMKKDDEVWDHVAPKTREKIMVKNEHGEMVEASAIDAILAAKEEDRKKSLLKKSKDSEEEQIAQDMARLTHLLSIGDADQTPDADGKVPVNPLEGALFLFQLPPVLPPLKITRQPKPRSGKDGIDFVKPEPTDDVVMLDQPAGNIDLTGTSETPDRGVKAEEGMEVDDEAPKDTSKELPYPPEGGYVGKLVVRRSGKVELDWGGQTLEMVPGIDTNFLTTAVLLEETNPLARSNEPAGTAYSMGKIHGKFVLAPKWGDEEEWIVDPSELEVNGELLP
jgi:DNA-directed RNA polymerase III subunit RPC4